MDNFPDNPESRVDASPSERLVSLLLAKIERADSRRRADNDLDRERDGSDTSGEISRSTFLLHDKETFELPVQTAFLRAPQVKNRDPDAHPVDDMFRDGIFVHAIALPIDSPDGEHQVERQRMLIVEQVHSEGLDNRYFRVDDQGIIPYISDASTRTAALMEAIDALLSEDPQPQQATEDGFTDDFDQEAMAEYWHSRMSEMTPESFLLYSD